MGPALGFDRDVKEQRVHVNLCDGDYWASKSTIALEFVYKAHKS